jgi:ribosomal-protein-alanine N-acetyltransferase
MNFALETDRLAFRKFHPDDLDGLCKLYADEDVRRYFPEKTLDRAQTRSELDWFLKGGDPNYPRLVLWAVILKSSGRFVGRGGFIPWTIDGNPEVEIAYMLDKEYWRQGLGAEMARALVSYGFTQLGLSRLIALIDSRNDASIRTAEGVGLRFEREVEVDGHPCLIYALNNY